MPLLPGDARVRAAINTGFLDAGGAAPTADELSDLSQRSRDDVFDSLRRLDRAGSIALRPGTLDLWIAPPFAAVPTLFRVDAGGRHYWASSAWSALAVAALVDDAEVTVRSALGGEATELTLRVGPDGPIDAGDEVVHFPVPAQRWSEGLVYTEATTLFFASSDDVDAWSERHRLPRGETVPVAQAFALAKAYFGDAREVAAHQRHRSDLEAMFRAVGLDGRFWALRPDRSLT
ncbi:MAG: organomercurial lyase [Kofleriaceae bacterium]